MTLKNLTNEQLRFIEKVLDEQRAHAIRILDKKDTASFMFSETFRSYKILKVIDHIIEAEWRIRDK